MYDAPSHPWNQWGADWPTVAINCPAHLIQQAQNACIVTMIATTIPPGFPGSLRRVNLDGGVITPKLTNNTLSEKPPARHRRHVGFSQSRATLGAGQHPASKHVEQLQATSQQSVSRATEIGTAEYSPSPTDEHSYSPTDISRRIKRSMEMEIAPQGAS